MLTGQHVPSDTEVQLYHRVLQEQGYRVKQGRYAETSATFTHSGGGVYSVCVFLWVCEVQVQPRKSLSFSSSFVLFLESII